MSSYSCYLNTPACTGDTSNEDSMCNACCQFRDDARNAFHNKKTEEYHEALALAGTPCKHCAADWHTSANCRGCGGVGAPGQVCNSCALVMERVEIATTVPCDVCEGPDPACERCHGKGEVWPKP